MNNLKSQSTNSDISAKKMKFGKIHFILKRIRLVSFNSLMLNFINTILQIYLIINRIKLLNNLTSSYSQKTSSLPILSNQQKLNNSIIINIFLLTFSIIFMIVHAIIGALRLRIYSHDGFKLGQNFDQTKSKLDFYPNRSNVTNTTVCSSSIISEETSVSISKQKLTKSNVLSKQYSDCFSFKKPAFWKELPPLGVIFHLLSSICLLLAEVQLSSRRIQLGNKPIGDIFSSKLDFLFGEPINRLKIFKTNQDLTLITSSIELTTMSPNQDTNIQEIINSRDDFTVFGQENQFSNFQSSLVFIVASNTISLDYLNFLIALITFLVKTCQTFWSSSKPFSFILLFFNALTLIALSISYGAFEILFKSNNLKVIARNFLFFSSKNEKRQDLFMSSMNSIDDYGHDLSSTFIFLISSLLLYVNIFLITKYGYRKFNIQKVKFEKNISSYIRKNYRDIECLAEINDKNMNEFSLDKTETLSNCTPKSQSEKSTSSFDTSLSDSTSICHNYLSFSYKENILSSILFLFYCILRSFFIYELIIIFKYTNDTLILTSLLIEILVIVGWIVALICLTVKEEWNFKLDSDYKILFWNHFYYANNLKQSFSNSEKTAINISISSQKNAIEKNQVMFKNPLIEKSSAQLESVKNLSETTKTPGLLVRDDTALNRSSYLSSSSITEVSSLMPSTFANNVNLPKLPSQYSMNQKLGSLKTNVLNPSSLISSTIMNDRNIVMINDDESSNDDSSIRLNPLRIDQDFYSSFNENSQIYSQIKRNNFDDLDEKNEDFKETVKKRSYSYRPSNNRSSTYSNNSLKKCLASSNSVIATIGEIMDDKSNQSQYLNMGRNCSVSIIHKSLNIIDSASSSATVDSGRDSITESPVSNINNQQVGARTSTNFNELNNSLITSKINSQTVQMKSSNQPLDTNC